MEDEDEEEGEKEPKKIQKTVWDWVRLNDNRAIWLRNPSDVTEDEYTNFYKAVSKVQAAL